MSKGILTNHSLLSELPAIEYSQLYENRAMLEAVLSYFPEGIMIASVPDGELILMNRAGRDLSEGISPTTPLNEYGKDWVLNDIDGRRVEIEDWPLSRAFRGESVNQKEYIIKLENGEQRYHLISAGPLRKGNGEIFAGIAIFSDITEQKQTEKALQDNEKRYRELFEKATDIIYSHDLAGNLLSFNKAASDLFGYSKETPLNINQIIAPECLEETRNMVRRKLSGQDTPTYQLDAITQEGKRVTLEVNTMLILEDGKPVGIQGIARNITERKREDNEVRVLKERFSKAFNASPFPMGIVRIRDGRGLDVNESALQQMGYLREETIGKTIYELGIAQDKEAFKHFWKSFLEQGTVRDFELAFQRKSGEKRVGLFSAERIDIDGEPCALISEIDITEKQYAERVKAATYKISEAANSAENLENFFAQIHQIVSELMYARNFYIALHDVEAKVLKIPYFVDEFDQNPHERTLRRGLTEYVLRTEKPLHGLPEAIRELEANNQVEAIGTFPADWVGVPLKTKDRTIGVLALQSYSEGITFSEEDLKILIFVSTQVASAIERRHAEDALRTSQQWFSKVFNLSPNPMGINRVKDGRYVDVNNSLLEITGYTHDEVIGKTSDDLNTWASPEQKEEFLQLLRQQRKIKNLETDYQTKFGDMRFGLVSAEIIEINGEEFVLTSVNDITKRKLAEDALRTSEQKLSLHLQQTPLGAIEWNNSFEITDWNPAAEKMFGYTKDEVKGKHPADLVIPSFDKEELSERWRARLEQKQGWQRTFKNSTKDGRVIICEWYNTPLIDKQGKVIGVASLVQDVTKRKHAEEALIASEERFSKAFNLSPLPMHIISLEDTRYIYVNDSFLKATGYTREEMMGKTGDELNLWVAKEDRRKIFKIFNESGQLHNVEVQYRRKDGEIRTGLGSSEMITLDGKPCALSIINDITERKHAEEALIASEERFSRAFNLSPLPMSLISLKDGKFIDVNDSFLKTTGYFRKDVIGKTGTELNLWVKEQDRQLGIQLINEQQQIYNLEGRYRRKDGSIRTILFSAETINISNDPCILSVINDITERKRAEEALIASEERFSKAFNLSPLPMHIVSVKDGKYIAVNDSFLKVTGYTRAEVIGKTGTELNLWASQEDRLKTATFIKEQGKLDNIELGYRRKNGEIRTTLVSAEIMTLGGETCALTIINDITERKHREAALRASEERFSTAFYLSPNPMCISTLEEGRLIDVNDAFALALLASREELIGRTSKEINFFVDYAQRDESIERVQKKKKYEADNIEMRYRRLNGEIRTGLLSAEIINIEGMPCLLTVVNDITERKKQEEELLTVRREWQATFDALSDTVMLIDKHDRLVRANKAFFARSGLAFNQVIGYPVREISHSDSQFISADDCPLCELRSKKTSGTIELPAGVISNFPILASIDPIFDSDGEFVGCVQVTRSLSALYTAREQAEQERISLRATIEQMAEGLMIFDESADCVRANSSAQSIFGFTLEQLLAENGSKLADGRFSDKNGRYLAPEEHPVRTALRQQQTVREMTLLYTRPDRQRVFLSITASPFFNEQGKLTGAVAIVRDITQQQREMERLQQADKLRALGQLASGVAHNFNNALAAVIGYSQLALRKTTDTEVEKYLRVIEQSSKDAARMVERIQNFSRTSSKHDEFVPARIADIVRDAVDITRPRWRFDADVQGIKYNVSVDWQAAEDLFINCTPSELREVCVNIILNSLDAMPAGGDLVVSATATEDNISISFKDTGTGMTDEVKSRVFDPFFTTKGTAGLGLGLSESYRIVERHFGNLDIESQPDFGTTFTITLPIMIFKDAVTKRETGEYVVAKKQLLVIDDEELVRYALASLLEELGHDVFQAASAKEALALLEVHKFDLVFTDLAMPDVDGIATAQKIKELQPNLKIVLMSGYSTDKVLERIKASTCIDAPMSKPFRFDEVRAVVKRMIGED
jgi:PAS domain S-box-containing protein